MNSFRYIKAVKSANQFTAISLIAVFFLCGTSLNVSAQAKVRDSSPITPAVNSGSSNVQQNEYSVFNQLQILKQEVLELRGLVEEQSYQLNRLKQQRLDDYLDLDKRISELSGNLNSSTASDNSNSGSIQNPPPRLPSVAPLPTATQNDNGEAEQALYSGAIDLLLNKQDYDAAQKNFNQYLEDFPSGKYAPNVHYWQGQIYLTENNKAAAEKSFSTLISNYPSNSKMPDAKYKLATILFDQGKKTEARALLDEVASSNTDASRLAKSFIANQY